MFTDLNPALDLFLMGAAFGGALCYFIGFCLGYFLARCAVRRQLAGYRAMVKKIMDIQANAGPGAVIAADLIEHYKDQAEYDFDRQSMRFRELLHKNFGVHHWSRWEREDDRISRRFCWLCDLAQVRMKK